MGWLVQAVALAHGLQLLGCKIDDRRRRHETVNKITRHQLGEKKGD